MNDWQPDAWRTKLCAQPIAYPNLEAFERVCQQLQQKTPLVSVRAIEQLHARMQEVYAGRAFLWQGGNCAESFGRADPEVHHSMCALLQKIASILSEKNQQPVVCVGRIAGQYAKPRTHDVETRSGVQQPSYRGDLINGAAFTEKARIPDPERMLLAHQHIERTHRALPDDLYTSHEALHLPYEAAFTRKTKDRWYNRSTHFPWVGVRTCDPQGAHIEYMRGIANPIALKIGPGFSSRAVQECMEQLNPERREGRLTLIHRFGAEAIEEQLPRLIDAVRAADQRVIWCCDPMHGNTQRQSGRKLRYVEDIAQECRRAFAIHKAQCTRLGGLHLELTEQDAVQCASRNTPQDTQLPSTVLLDPCLNPAQAVALVDAVVPQQ